MSEASREVANLTGRKNPHTPLYGVKEFVCLSEAKFDLNYLRTGEIEWADIFGGISTCREHCPAPFTAKGVFSLVPPLI